MTQEEKQLLLKDLCARLPHKQKVCYKIRDNSEEITETLSGCLLDYFKTGKIAVVKPYLRPMSSMTEEEQKEFVAFHCVNLCPIIMDICLTIDNESKMLDWLNVHHFDFRNLIEKGLALPAKEGMYQ